MQQALPDALTVNAGLYMAFKHHILFGTNLAENLGCNWFRITHDIVSKLLHTTIWSSCAVQFKSEQSPFLGQVIPVYLDLLLGTGFNLEHVVLFLCHIFTQRRMNDRKIEWSNGCCFGLQQLLANSIEDFKFHFTWKKRWLVMARKLQSIKTLLTLEMSQYHKSGSMVSSSKPVAASIDCLLQGNTLCLCVPAQPAQAEQESCPKSLALDFAL